MIINLHAHLAHKNMYSDKFWEITVKTTAKSSGIPETLVWEKLMPQFWESNAKNYVNFMELAKIDKAFIMGIDFGLNPDIGEGPWSIEQVNEWIANQASEYPDKLIPVCAIDPRRGEVAVKLLEKAVTKWEMKGLKLHPTTGYFPDDPSYFPLYEKCEELKVPLFSHTGATMIAPFMSKFADPIYLDTIAAKFPELNIVMVHFGSLSYTHKCIELMLAKPNLYADLSGYQLHAKFMPEYFLRTLRHVLDMPSFVGLPLRKRIMFGTDWPYVEVIMGQKNWVEWIQNIPSISEGFGLTFKKVEIKRILGKNAGELLKI